jgi:hypothetical protein
MTIDIEALEKFCEENPCHGSPRDELEVIFEYLPENDPCLIEATHLLDKWDRNNTPLESQRGEVDFFFMKWNFCDAKGKPWNPNGTSFPS